MSPTAAGALGALLPSGIARPLRYLWHRRGTLRARRTLGRPDPELREWADASWRPVSIVIPSYNDIPLLKKCLASIEATLGDREHEVIVVDDFCQPANSARLRELEGGRVRVVFKERRMGFAVSVNRGMAEARYDIILLNSDIVALDGWAEALQRAAYESGDPRVGMVSARLIYPDGRIQYGGTFWARTWVPAWFAHRYAGQLADHPPALVPGYNWGASGACLYIPRSTYERMGGLDEEYWLGFEDVDYAMRGWVEGIRSWYEPRAALFHHESATRGRRQGNRELASLRLFWSKWRQLHQSKTDGTPTREADVLLDRDGDALWRRYVEQQAAALTGRGWTVRLHEVDRGAALEAADRIASARSLKIATSTATLDAAWLGSSLHGIPVALLDRIDAAPPPEHVAALRPEFDYIAPNQWTAATLVATTAWPAAATVPPALASSTTPIDGSGILVIAPDEAGAAALASHLPGASTAVGPIDEVLLARVVADAPRVVVSTHRTTRSLEPLALMSTGAALVLMGDDAPTAMEVLDGLSCFRIPDGDFAMLAERVTHLVEDDSAHRSVRANGLRTASETAEAAAVLLDLALSEIAERRA